jgi:hypothetical protein
MLLAGAGLIVTRAQRDRHSGLGSTALDGAYVLG